ncbi:hypothetical protein OAB57_02745 [Bacteriovoracaceae bacterium]|nr:hypothetical protein [Bacteriovoracaceae bacterium]
MNRNISLYMSILLLFPSCASYMQVEYKTKYRDSKNIVYDVYMKQTFKADKERDLCLGLGIFYGVSCLTYFFIGKGRKEALKYALVKHLNKHYGKYPKWDFVDDHHYNIASYEDDHIKLRSIITPSGQMAPKSNTPLLTDKGEGFYKGKCQFKKWVKKGYRYQAGGYYFYVGKGVDESLPGSYAAATNMSRKALSIECPGSSRRVKIRVVEKCDERYKGFYYTFVRININQRKCYAKN